MSTFEKRIDKLEGAVGGAVKAPAKFWMLFEVFIRKDARTTSETLCAMCEELGEGHLPRGMCFYLDEYLQKYIEGIRSRGGEVALVFDLERCTRDIYDFHPKGQPGTPERERENAENDERIKARVVDETLFRFDGVSDKDFIEAYQEWKAAHEQLANAA